MICGGSNRSLERLIAPFRERIHLRTRVRQIRRLPGCVEIVVGDGERRRFDEVVVAVPSDEPPPGSRRTRRLLCHIEPLARDRSKARAATFRLRASAPLLFEDYRELRGRFDKLASIAMIEAAGHLPSVGAIANRVSRAPDLRVVHLADLTPHCGETLRLWEYSLRYCEGGFEARHIGLLQIVLDKPGCREQLPALAEGMPIRNGSEEADPIR